MSTHTYHPVLFYFLHIPFRTLGGLHHLLLIQLVLPTRALPKMFNCKRSPFPFWYHTIRSSDNQSWALDQDSLYNPTVVSSMNLVLPPPWLVDQHLGQPAQYLNRCILPQKILFKHLHLTSPSTRKSPAIYYSVVTKKATPYQLHATVIRALYSKKHLEHSGLASGPSVL